MSEVSITAATVTAAAGHLLDHRRSGSIMDDLPEGLRPTSLADAYAIQDQVVAGLLARSGRGDARPIGYKVACTNPIAQAALKIDRPVFGRLLAPTTYEPGVTLEATAFTTRVIEAEFGVEMAADVPAGSGPHTAATIAAYVGAMLPSIEVVDHRFVDWSVGALSVAADNAIHGCWVPGAAYGGDWRALDLAAHAVTVTVDGTEATIGTGAAVLGHPLNVVAWLAGELEAFGRQLRAGDRITTGVATDVFGAEAGQTVTADFGELGAVTIHWT
jgi:2-keto-4-pentenoate hydratase